MYRWTFGKVLIYSKPSLFTGRNLLSLNIRILVSMCVCFHSAYSMGSISSQGPVPNWLTKSIPQRRRMECESYRSRGEEDAAAWPGSTTLLSTGTDTQLPTLHGRSPLHPHYVPVFSRPLSLCQLQLMAQWVKGRRNHAQTVSSSLEQTSFISDNFREWK